MLNLSDSPPRAPPTMYSAPLGTRWEKEMAAAGGATAFDLPTDPSIIGPWILGECVGKGASGRVKIAKHRRTGQLAAVKILPLAPLVSSRASLATQQAKSDKQRLGIDREITMMKLMNHPNIMRIYDVYEGDNELFLVLEYVEGGELFDFLVNRGKLTPKEALIYFRQIVYGLNYAHTFSIIHRDLKPENILIASLSPPLIKIADWGMAAFAPPLIQLETSCGSPHYASPEIVNGERYQGNATDIWSCGVILYALLTGRLPFDDKDVRTLLEKVKVGKYEMPTCIDPMAQDLISKMLVVDVKQRITIPQILAHPWLMSQPAIRFAAYDGNTYTMFPPPLPPSPSVLARPIPSSEMIDLELFTSLRIIWGRYADVNGDCIRRDLCSRAGYGVYAKAFYFLLGRYRDESSKIREVDAEFDSGITLNLGTLTLADFMAVSGSPPSMSGGLRKYEVSHVFLNSQAQYEARRSSSANPANGHRGLRPKNSRKRTSTDGSILTEKGRFDPIIASTPPILHKGQSKIPTPQKDGPAGSLRPKSAALSGLGRGSAPRPFLPRRGFTHSVVPEKRNGDSDVAWVGPSVRFSQHLQQLQDKTMENASYSSPKRPVTSFGPRLTSAETSRITSGADSAAKTVINSDLRTPVGFPRPFVTTKGRVSMDSSKVGLPILPPLAIDEITKQMNDLHIKLETSPVDADMVAKEGKKSNIPLAKMRRYRKLHEKDDKENQSLDEGWSQETADSGGVGIGIGDVAINRDIGKDIGNIPVSLAKTKKSRPPPLNLPPKRSTLAMLGSPIVLSSPVHVPSSANRSMASPGVSDFKGWFSNLFNWRTSNGNGGILYSPDDQLVTRLTITRILEGMGVVVSGGQGDHRFESEGILIGRIDTPTTDPVSGLPMKNIRFRIEFRPNSETSEIQTVDEDVPYLGPSPRYNISALNSPVTPVNVAGAAVGPLSSRPRTSFLLGGRPVSHGTPLPSPAFTSARGDAGFPPGCLCAVALVYEKGSMSTFKLLWRRLKDVYCDVASGYPCLSPAIPNTPYVESHRGMVV